MPQVAIRKPAVAGQFYPDRPAALRAMVEGYLADAQEAPSSAVACLIVPHAGLVYSGPTAAHAYARAAGLPIERVILMGCSHHYRFEGASIVTQGVFETALGAFPIDEDFASRLAAKVGSYEAEPHVPEHALEVQLPFLAVALGEVPIVPILFGSSYGAWHERFADTLAEMTGPSDLVVATTDLSHYLTEQQANEIDKRSIKTLLGRDVQRLADENETGRCSMCSFAAVGTAMRFSLDRHADRWTLLDYRTSAKASGNTSRVVGYAAVSMEAA